MSRVSSKSSLSPASGGGIDLGKGDGIDLGQKTQTSASSGGIGLTQEVGQVGGMSVTGGISVDVSPIELDISATVDPSDPNNNSVSIAGSAEVPGGLIGIGGGVKINTNTGQIIGGSISGEIGGFGVEVAGDEKGLGLTLSYQIPFTPVTISIGIGPASGKSPTPTPTPSPTPNPSLPPGALSPGQIDVAMPGNICGGFCITGYYDDGYDGQNGKTFGLCYKYRPFADFFGRPTGGGIVGWNDEYIDDLPNAEANFGSVKEYTDYINVGTNLNITHYMIPENIRTECFPSPTPTPSPTPSPSLTPPPPSPPPRKEMDECCRLSIRLQRLTVRHLGAVKSRIQEPLPEGVNPIGSTQEGFNQAFPFEVRKRWIDPVAKDNEKVAITNARQLTLVLGGMMERLERVMGTAEFYKDSDKRLRQSEGNLLSWLNGKNDDFKYPDPNDFWLNTDDGIINEKKLEVRSIADGLRYQIEALNRLERILPIAELKDSSIPARWIYPGGKGQLRVGNLIHLCEYMIRKDDRDRGFWPQKIKIKDADPAIKGDQPYEVEFHSQADLLRGMFQMILDMEGDGDMGSNYDLRRTYLDVMGFQLTVKNNKYLQAIAEYLNFDMIEEVDKVPIPFDPYAGRNRSGIEKWWSQNGFGNGTETAPPNAKREDEIEQLSEGLLQNSELEIGVVKFGSLDEKREPKTLKEALIEILKHSSASAAAVTERVSEGALERTVEAAGLAQKLASFLMRRDIRESLGIGDLDQWIASAEKGYTDNPESESLRFPESSSLEPYGRPTSQNPVIREIDTKEPKAD
jgi:hypothetical protein